MWLNVTDPSLHVFWSFFLRAEQPALRSTEAEARAEDVVHAGLRGLRGDPGGEDKQEAEQGRAGAGGEMSRDSWDSAK